MRSALAALTVLIASGSMSGCGRRLPAPLPGSQAHYTLGPPWQSDGYWFYPAEEASYQATGLAVVDAPSSGRHRITADGEAYDPGRLTAAHQTLQLPVMLHVRNLENGREITLRVNDRGPASPGRLLSVTPRAALLLGMIPGQATRVRLEEDQRLDAGLRDQIADAPKPDAVAAPVGAVDEQTLTDQPSGTAGGAVRAAAAPATTPSREPGAGEPRETITMEPTRPGQLWIDAGHFMQPGYARSLAAELAGTVRQEGYGRSAIFLVRVGPFNLPAEADAALDHARSAGVTGARIIVE